MDFIFNFTARTAQLVSQLNQARQSFETFSNSTANSLRRVATTAETQIKSIVSDYESARNIVADLRNQLTVLRSGTRGQQANVLGTFIGDPNLPALVSRRIKDLNLQISDLQVQIRAGVADSKQYRQQLDLIKKTSRALTNEMRAFENLMRTRMQTTLQNTSNSINLIRTASGSLARGFAIATVAATAFIAAFIPLIKMGAEYEQSIARIVSVNTEFRRGTRQAEELVRGVEATIAHLGATTNFTASQVAEAGRVLAQAGLNANEIISALPATLNLANAGFIELGEAASVAADFMNAFGLAGWEIQRVSDAMAKTQAVSNTTIEQLTHAFSFATATAAAYGQRIEDVSVALAALANSGIKASRAGTGISRILDQLTMNIDKTDKFMRSLGSSFEAVNPNAVGLVDILKEFRKVNIRAGEAAAFFGKRAGRALNALVNLSDEAFSELENQINNAFGDSIDQAIKNWDNLQGSFRQFHSIVEQLGINFFKTFKGTLKVGIDAVVDSLRQLNAFLEDSPLARLATGAALAGVALSSVVVAVGAMSTPMLLLAAAVAGVATNLIGLQMSTLAANSALHSATQAYQDNRAERVRQIFEIRQTIVALDNEALHYRSLAAAARAAGDAEAYEANISRVASITSNRNLKQQVLDQTKGQHRRARANFSTFRTGADATAGAGAGAQLGLGLARLKEGLTSVLSLIGKFRSVIVVGTIAIAAFTSAIVAMFSSLKSGDEITTTTKKVETLKGIIEFLKSVVASVVGAFKTGFNTVIGIFGDVEKSSSSFSKQFQEVGTLLWQVLLGLVDVAKELWSTVGVLAGALAGALFGALKLVLVTVTSTLKVLSSLITKFIELKNAVKEWLGLGTDEAFSELNDTVERADEAVQEYNKSMLEQRDATDSALGKLQEYAGLASRVSELNILETDTLLELVDNFGDVNNAIKETEKNISRLKEDLAGIRDVGGSENEIRAVNERIAQAKRILETLNQVKRDNNLLTREGFKLAREENELRRESARIDREREQRTKALKKIEKDLHDIMKDAANLRKKTINDELSGLDQLIEKAKEQYELKKQNLEIDIKQSEADLQKIKDKGAIRVAESDTLKKQEEAFRLNKEKMEKLDAQIKEAFKKPGTDTMSPAFIDDPKLKAAEARLRSLEKEHKRLLAAMREETKAAGQLTDAEKQSIQQLETSINKRKALIQGSAAEVKNAEKQVTEEKKRLLDEQRKNEIAFRRAQEIELAKLSGDKLKVAELEREAFLASEKDRIDKEFALNDEATKKRKSQAISAMKEIANARLAEAKKEIAEDLAKEQERKRKEQEKKQKSLLDVSNGARKKAANHLASQVQSTSQLLQLNTALDLLETRKEIRARNAVEAYQDQRDKLQRLLKTQESAEGRTAKNIASGIQKAKEQLNFLKASAGKALTNAGLFKGSSEVAEGIIGQPVATSDAMLGLTNALNLAAPIMQQLANALQGTPNLAPLPQIAGVPVGGENAGAAHKQVFNKFEFHIKNETDSKKLVATLKKTLNDAVFGPIG